MIPGHTEELENINLNSLLTEINLMNIFHIRNWWRRGRDRIVGLPPFAIITKVVNSNRACSEVYSIQHYVIKFASDLRQVGGYLRVLRFSPPINWPPRYIWYIVESGSKYHNLSPIFELSQSMSHCHYQPSVVLTCSFIFFNLIKLQEIALRHFIE